MSITSLFRIACNAASRHSPMSGPGPGCGTDTVVAGDNNGLNPANVGLDSNLDPQAASPVLNAGETSGYCTGALGAIDIFGNPRPFGAACDAGAAERQS
jgi:hypothetical protein